MYILRLCHTSRLGNIAYARIITRQGARQGAKMLLVFMCALFCLYHVDDVVAYLLALCYEVVVERAKPIAVLPGVDSLEVLLPACVPEVVDLILGIVAGC